MKRTQRGFTLVELLVVVTIIGILIGLLMPSLRRAREHGWSAKCKVNLRNLQVACINHATDHNGSLPHAGSFEIERDMNGSERWHETRGWVHWVGYPEYPDDQNWHEASHEDDNDVKTPWWGDDAIQSIQTGTLWDYLGHQHKVYLCPRFAKAGLWSAGNSPASDDGPPRRSYVMNSYFHDRDNKSRWHKNLLHQTDISKRLLFADSQPDQTFEGHNFPRWFKRNTGNMHEKRRSWDGSLNVGTGSDTNNPVEAIGTLHLGLGHAVFLDGHVEAHSWQTTMDHCQATW
ncbi:MAG: type II secretion system protein [Verrucomicrobia bacterium]|jgi:prepilin-type N-terminal cleavage/methylation domain-containing protein|nr:type II secretion system protein [Verrucomicrobiota bacterium]MBT7067428.1 type II secretion system protein [Verrucomicrobiota bacterium]MBT7698835.1 type II secretion system protein [Verrucomicrobiota bacterium]